jgi:probable phosphoglycerate mutase
MAATLFLARHGETDWNLERRWQGHADPPLNATGRAQSLALASVVRGLGIEAAYSSDLARARETAELVVDGLGVGVRLDRELREADVGEWSGLTTAEIERRFPAGAARRRAGRTGWDHGESYEAMAARVERALIAIAANHPGGRVLVVTHGGPVRSVRRLAGCPLPGRADVENCELDRIVVEDGRLRWLDSTCGGLHQPVRRSGGEAG